MKEFSYTITDELGIHARPAGLLVKEAGRFKSEIKLLKDGREGNLKKIFSVMGLAVKQGERVIIKAEGDDEDEAAAAIESFMKKNL